MRTTSRNGSGVIRRMGRSVWLKVAVMAAAAACLIPLASGTPSVASADSTSDATSAANALDMKDVNGLMMGKSATAGSDGRSADVTLGSYSTGGVETKVTNLPTDAVIMLPYDVEMTKKFDGSATSTGDYSDPESRWTAAVEAVKEYAQALHDDAINRNVTHRLALIIYSGQGSSAEMTQAEGVDMDRVIRFTDEASDMSLDSSLTNLSQKLSACSVVKHQYPNAGTCASKGYRDDDPWGEGNAAAAKNAELRNYSITSTVGGVDPDSPAGTPGAKRNKQVIYITDSVMGVRNKGKFWQPTFVGGNMDAAHSFDMATGVMTRIINDKHVSQCLVDKNTVLTVGQCSDDYVVDFDQANAHTAAVNEYSISLVADTNPSVDINGSYGLGTQTAFGYYLDGGSTLASRFLQLTSSNYPDATSLDDAGVKASDRFFSSITDEQSLIDKLQDISTSGYVDSSLGADATTADVGSKYFSVPADAEDVKVYEQSATGVDADGKPTGWSADVTPVDASKVSVDVDKTANSVKVSGWDYDANYVGARTDETFGKRLIVKFTETANKCFLGGNKVPTNDPATSGVSDSDGNLVAAFTTKNEQPTVDVALQDNCPATVANGKAYEGSTLSGLGSLVSPATARTDADTDFADLTYAVKIGSDDVGSYDPATGKVTFTDKDAAKVSSPGDLSVALTPTITAKTAGSITAPVTGTALTATVSVFSPQADVENTLVESGKDTTLKDNLVSWDWWNKSTNKVASSTDFSGLTLVSDEMVGATSGAATNADMQGKWTAGAVKPSPDPAGTNVAFDPTDNTDFTVMIQVKAKDADSSTATTLDAADVNNSEAVAQDDIDASVQNDRNSAEAHDFTVYVKHSDPCYLGGSDIPVAGGDDGCIALVDGLVQNGAAYEDAVIGGGDDGSGTDGYSSLINDSAANVLAQKNPTANIIYTFKDSDGNKLGEFTIPAGSTKKAQGSWTWEDGAQKYLKGVGAHKLSVELTTSTHTKDENGNPVVLKTWNFTMNVYVPAMDVADSDIIQGHYAELSANMLPGSVLSEVIGASGSLTEPNKVYWTKDNVEKAEADNDIAAEKNMLTSKPTATPMARFLEGDQSVGLEMGSDSSVKPDTTTTFQVKFQLRGSTYSQSAETTASGLTDEMTSSTELYLWNQHNEYVGGNNSSMIGAPLDSAANSLKPDPAKGAFTIYVGYAPCYLGGSRIPSTDPNTGCIGLIDAAVQNGAAHEYAVVGGGDDGKAGNGYSGLIYSAAAKILLQENPSADITYTVKNSDGEELGHYTIPAGSKSVDDGKWTWEDSAQEYLKGVGAHKVSVELTASTHDLDANGDPVVLRTWTPTVTVYIPAVHLNDSDIKLGSENPLKNNMLPGGVLSENTGVTGSPSASNEVYWEKKAMGEKASGDNDLAAERNVLTSAPAVTPVAEFLEGDSKVGSDLESSDTVSPTTSTTFQVKFDLSGSTDGDVETTPTGLTGDFTEGTTEQALYSQVNEYQLNAPNGAFGDFLGVPLDSAENPLSPDPAKAAFTIYVSGKTVSSLPLTGGTGAGLAAVLTGVGTILFAGLLAGVAWWTRRSRSAAHALRA